ncbi:hypothetical protein SAMN06265222_11611 [Neorhodopirellula lusitana]|uniref:Uncharacterized protein n=1 Tax=Neorhodopirellula lusitana TaxID=445327 RepID=A0ABY1QJY8_9BACT|nr:hypothetical protein SAMN06265222_11611 [Neorhodopirellula lusitana]
MPVSNPRRTPTQPVARLNPLVRLPKPAASISQPTSCLLERHRLSSPLIHTAVATTPTITSHRRDPPTTYCRSPTVPNSPPPTPTRIAPDCVRCASERPWSHRQVIAKPFRWHRFATPIFFKAATWLGRSNRSPAVSLPAVHPRLHWFNKRFSISEKQ